MQKLAVVLVIVLLAPGLLLVAAVVVRMLFRGNRDVTRKRSADEGEPRPPRPD
jgi:hypothetical protein